MKTTWFDIEQDVVNKSSNTIKRGVKVNVKLSPFDVPISASSDYDEDSHFLLINFKYYGQKEKLKEVRGETDGVIFVVGKSSGRLFGIKINCAKHIDDGVDELKCELTLEKAAHDLDELRLGDKLRSQSTEAIQSVISHYKDKLLSSDLKVCNSL